MQLAPDFARQRALLSGTTPAFTDHSTGRIWSFAQVDQAATELAAHLSQFGGGARIGYLAANRAEFFVALFAAQRAGCILCPLDYRAPRADLQHMCDITGLAAMITDCERLPQSELFRLPLIALAPEGGFNALEPASDFAPTRQRLSDAWYLLFTSGTTGRPRAAIQTAGMAQAVAMNIAQSMGLLESDRSLCCLPLCHTAGVNLFTLPLFLWGGHSHILPRYSLEAVSNLLISGALTQLFALPTIWQQLAAAPAPVLEALGKLRGCVSGGAPLSARLAHELAASGITLRNGYGMTETGPTGFLSDLATAQRSPTSIGQPQLFTEARLAPQPGLPQGCGELQIRGATVTPGYWGRPRAALDTFTPDGWLHTGDIARLDDAGAWHITGRLKDMYVSGGENVWPEEVEGVLLRHPAVAEAAVIAISDPVWGETGRAFVRLNPALPAPTEDDIRQHCRAYLAAFKAPRYIALVQDFPRTATGKIRKSSLMDLT